MFGKIQIESGESTQPPAAYCAQLDAVFNFLRKRPSFTHGGIIKSGQSQHFRIDVKADSMCLKLTYCMPRGDTKTGSPLWRVLRISRVGFRWFCGFFELTFGTSATSATLAGVATSVSSMTFARFVADISAN